MPKKVAGGRMLSDEIWDMGAAEPRPKIPKPIVVLVVVWAVAQLVHFLATRDPEAMWPEGDRDATRTVVEVLQFIYGFLVVALVANGILRRSRFGWILAFVWQGLEAGFGLVNLTLNDYELETYTYFSGIPFYGIALPIAVAVISFVLLLLPSTRGWIRGDQSLGSSRSVV